MSKKNATPIVPRDVDLSKGGRVRWTFRSGAATVCQCGATHSSLRWSHCPSCHETFSTESNFDCHRMGGHGRRWCASPESVGLVPSPHKRLLTGEVLWSLPGVENPLWASGNGKNSHSGEEV